MIGLPYKTRNKKAEINTTKNDFKLVYYISAEQPSSGTMRIYIGGGIYVVHGNYVTPEIRKLMCQSS